MNRQKIALAMSIIFVVVLGSVWLVLRGLEMKPNQTANTTSGLHFQETKSDGRALYESEIHQFSLLVPTVFSLDGNSERDSEKTTYSFRRVNQNTSEESNRDTPNGFNTAANDLFVIEVIPRPETGESIFPYNNELLSARLAMLDIPMDILSGEETTVGDHHTIRAITSSGIDARQESYYLESEKYWFILSSSDVGRSELEALVRSVLL